tara:strand:- start:27810 stop:28484 length:675 start_codon:yes stop_codon:yes gene_type:complete
MKKSFILPSCWESALSRSISSESFQSLTQFLNHEYEAKTIYPKSEHIFEAFHACPLEKVKVVILGQDPYHGEGQAHGLSFSVMPDVPIPPSLRNIYKELSSDLGIATPTHGHLKKWAEQGVLLLNNVLSVEQGKAGSHHKKGWEKFTDDVVEVLNQREGLVFILWGSPAQKKARAVSKDRHLVLESVHPSPLSSYRGFFGSKPFSKTNDYLIAHGQKAIDWRLD